MSIQCGFILIVFSYNFFNISKFKKKKKAPPISNSVCTKTEVLCVCVWLLWSNDNTHWPKTWHQDWQEPIVMTFHTWDWHCRSFHLRSPEVTKQQSISFLDKWIFLTKEMKHWVCCEVKANFFIFFFLAHKWYDSWGQFDLLGYQRSLPI